LRNPGPPGPNCLGNPNARAGLVTMPDDRAQHLAVGPVASSASPAALRGDQRTLEERGIDTGLLVTSGNGGVGTAITSPITPHRMCA
jgi:hypothetical protein